MGRGREPGLRFGRSIDDIDDHPMVVMAILGAIGGGIAAAGLHLSDRPLAVAGILLALVGAWVSIADLISRRHRSVTRRELVENEIIVRAHDVDRLPGVDAAEARGRLDELVGDAEVAAHAFHLCVESAGREPAQAAAWLAAADQIEDALRRHGASRRR